MVSLRYHRAVGLNTLRLIAMGGTISFRSTPDGAQPHSRGTDLLSAIGVRSEVDVVGLFNGSSIGIGFNDLIRLRACIADAEAGGNRGIVITHGTDTLEE